VAKAVKSPKLAANWVAVELFGALNKGGKTLAESPVSAADLAGLVRLIEDNTLSGRLAKDVFALMFTSGRSAAILVEEKGLRQVTDTAVVEETVLKVLTANPDKVAEYKAGKEKLFGFFVGQIIKESGGKANPALVNELLKKHIG
jgi:aspartyl-tRNA(Asn)/glutamyl-tRNA(Gln) amidotransferase subunit B